MKSKTYDCSSVTVSILSELLTLWSGISGFHIHSFEYLKIGTSNLEAEALLLYLL